MTTTPKPQNPKTPYMIEEINNSKNKSSRRLLSSVVSYFRLILVEAVIASPLTFLEESCLGQDVLSQAVASENDGLARSVSVEPTEGVALEPVVGRADVRIVRDHEVVLPSLVAEL